MIKMLNDSSNVISPTYIIIKICKNCHFLYDKGLLSISSFTVTVTKVPLPTDKSYPTGKRLALIFEHENFQNGDQVAQRLGFTPQSVSLDPYQVPELHR